MKTVSSMTEELKKGISAYNQIVNEVGVWFFLATLACWSVDLEYRVFAASAAIVIFVHMFFSRLGRKKFFITEVREIEDAIVEQGKGMSPPYKKKLELELKEIKNQLSLKRIFLRVPAYYISLVSWASSMFIWASLINNTGHPF